MAITNGSNTSVNSGWGIMAIKQITRSASVRGGIEISELEPGKVLSRN